MNPSLHPLIDRLRASLSCTNADDDDHRTTSLGRLHVILYVWCTTPPCLDVLECMHRASSIRVIKNKVGYIEMAPSHEGEGIAPLLALGATVIHIWSWLIYLLKREEENNTYGGPWEYWWCNINLTFKLFGKGGGRLLRFCSTIFNWSGNQNISCYYCSFPLNWNFHARAIQKR